MKKYISFILIAVISLSSITINAEENTFETTEATGMFVEIVENGDYERNIQESEIIEENTNLDESKGVPTVESES